MCTLLPGIGDCLFQDRGPRSEYDRSLATTQQLWADHGWQYMPPGTAFLNQVRCVGGWRPPISAFRASVGASASYMGLAHFRANSSTTRILAEAVHIIFQKRCCRVPQLRCPLKMSQKQSAPFVEWTCRDSIVGLIQCTVVGAMSMSEQSFSQMATTLVGGWWDTVLTNRGPLVHFPVVAKVPYSSTRVLKVFFPFFSP